MGGVAYLSLEDSEVEELFFQVNQLTDHLLGTVCGWDQVSCYAANETV